MNIKYRILKVVPEEHSIEVRYFTDKITEDSLASDFGPDRSILRTDEGYPVRCRTDYNLNVWQTPSPSKEEIVAYILECAPADWLHLQEQILDKKVDTSLSSVANLVGVVETVTKEPTNM